MIVIVVECFLKCEILVQVYLLIYEIKSNRSWKNKQKQLEKYYIFDSKITYYKTYAMQRAIVKISFLALFYVNLLNASDIW